jgi:hypothetical protein
LVTRPDAVTGWSERMQRLVLVTVLAGVMTGIGPWTRDLARAASPAPTSYTGVEKAIASIRLGWSQPGAAAQPNAPGWNALFDAVLNDLREYSHAESSEARLAPLNRIYQISTALASVPWVPAQELREEMRKWLRPRVRLAWAQRRLDEKVRGLPPSDDTSIMANRQRWLEFVENDLGKALGKYNSADTVSQRQAGLKDVHEALRSLQSRNTEQPWQPSWDLASAVNDLFNQPNLDITADVSVVSPYFDQNLVTTGPVFRKGYWSQVTAGPKTGFGLLASDDGIAFYNSQLLSSATPITDFNSQVANNPQGQRATKLYGFSATSYDWEQLTVYTVLGTSGLSLWPAFNHNIDALICSAPTPGGGFGRLIAGLIGMNQQKITQKVYEGAIGNFRQRIPQEAMEEAQERMAGQQSTRNAELQQYLIGNNRLAIQQFLVSGLSLRSRPEAVYVGGLLQSKGGSPRGADAPQPASLAAPDPGLSADVHLTSVLSSVAEGFYEREDVQAVNNLMFVTKDVPPGTEPKDAVTVTRNVDFSTFSKAVDEVKKAKNLKVTAIRIKRPPDPPEFAVDAKGNLVAMVRDVEVEIPAPDKSTQAGAVIGVPARIVRIKMPQLEAALSYQLESPTLGSHRIKAKLEVLSPSPSSEVQAILNDEAKPVTVTRFSKAAVITALVARARSQPITVNLDKLNLRGFAVQSISPLDPSGWLRVNLARTAAQPGEAGGPAIP